MKAIIYERYGNPDVLQVKEIPKPSIKNDEVLIQVHAAEATKSDCEMRSFNFQVKWFILPLRIAVGLIKPKRQILGCYFSGVVEEVGEDVLKFKKGEQIFGCTALGFGAYCEYMCLKAKRTIVPKPFNMSFEEASTVPLGGLNALHFLRLANIRRGEKILINGAGGSIGCYAVQIAKTMGAEVTAVDSAIKEEMLRGIGADHFIDYGKEDFTQGIETYDIIFAVVANTPYSKCIRMLNPQGRYLMANPRLFDMFRSVFVSRCTNKTARYTFAQESEEELLALKKMIEEGKIRSVVDKIYPLEQAAEAHRRVETEQRLGTIAITMGQEVH